MAVVMAVLTGNANSFREVSCDKGDAIAEEEVSHFALKRFASFVIVEADEDFLSVVAVHAADVEELFFLFCGDFACDGVPAVTAEGEDVKEAFADGEIVILERVSVELDDLALFLVVDFIELSESRFDGVDAEDDFVENLVEFRVIEFEVGIFRPIVSFWYELHDSAGGVARLMISVEVRYHEPFCLRGVT